MNRANPAPTRALRLRPPHLRLAALGLLLLCSISGFLRAADAARDFDLPAGQARDTLKRFAAQAQVEIVFPSDNTLDVVTNAVRGRFSPEEAVAALLAGTTLTAARDPKTDAYAVRPRSLTPSMAPAQLARSASISAQTVVPGPGPSSAGDVPVQLSPFEVKADANGYLAAETTTGTRYAAPIKELPFSVNIVSSEFMEDFHLFDLSGMAALSYTSSFSNEASEVSTGSIVVRGIRGFSLYKNGIREGGVFGPASIDRIEVIKGASASIYGQAEPSGMVNRVTKEGGPRPFQSLTVDVGTQQYSRAMLDVNQPLAAKLFFRLAGSYEYSEQFQKEFAKFARKNFYASASYHLSKTSVLTVHAEYVKFRSYAQNAGGAPFVVVPFTFNNATTTQTVGLLGVGEWKFGNTERLNINGPYAFNEVEYTQIDGKYSGTITDWLSFQILGSHFNRNQHNTSQTNTGGTYNASTKILGGVQGLQLPRNWGRQWNGRADLLAQFKVGSTAHRVLLSADWVASPTHGITVRSTLPGSTIPTQNYLLGGPYVSPVFEPYYSHYNPGDSSVWNQTTSRTKSRTIDKGVGLAEQAILFNRRLFLSAGIRYENLYFTQIDFLNAIRPSTSTQAIPAGQLVRYPKVDSSTFQTGAVYLIGSHLSAFVNYSTSFVPQDSNPPLDFDGNPVPPETGRSSDLGLKADFPARRLTFTTAVYDSHRGNLPRTALNAAGQRIEVPGIVPGTVRNYSTVQDVRSHGAEFDGNWALNDSFSLSSGVSWNQVRFVKVPNVTEQYLLGIPPDRTPPWTANLAATYRHNQGVLKGLSLRLGARFRDASLVNTSTASIYGNSGVKGPPLTLGGQRFETYFFRNKSFTLVDVGVGYRIRKGAIDHKWNLTLSNITNEHPVVGPQIQLGFTANLSYTIKH